MLLNGPQGWRILRIHGHGFNDLEPSATMTWPETIGVSLVPITASTAAFYYACVVPSSQVLGPVLVRGPAESKSVALTFDDGPAPPFTTKILDILRDYKVPATFFVCGKNVERSPAVLERIKAENHTIGNHTYSHPFLYFKTQKRITEEIDRTQTIIERVTGERPKLFRPPYGSRWFGLFPALRERKMPLIQWSDAGFDWRKGYGPAEIARRALKNLTAGSVILLHDGHNAFRPDQFDRASTVAALPTIIEGARKAGLTFVPVQRFLSEQASR